MKKEVIKTENFNRGWQLQIVKDGKGFSIKLNQFNHEAKSWFRWTVELAETVFAQCKKELNLKPV